METKDFYFDCPVLKCRMLQSSCERNKNEQSRLDSLGIIKQNKKCKACRAEDRKCYQSEGFVATAEDYNAGIQITPKVVPDNRFSPIPHNFAEWSSNRSGERVRIN